MKIACYAAGSVGTNNYVISDDNGITAIIDCDGSPAPLYQYVEQNHLKVTHILLTHGHIDHMGACESLRTELGVKVYALTEEEDLLLDAKQNLSVYIARKVVTFAPDEFVHDGQELELAGVKLEVFHTPGHTPGGCSYYVADAGCVFSGDTLFAESVGRSDFPGGSTSALVRAVKEKLFLLPDDTLVCPGHGEETTIGHEKKYNSFV